MRNNNIVFKVNLILICLFLSGCGGGKQVNRVPVYPVSGKVTYKGQPVVGADVTFFCKERNMSSFAKTDDQGKFRLTSFASFDGAPAGKQIITVSKIEAAAAATKEVDVSDPAYDPFKLVEDAKKPPPSNLIPSKYADPKSTDLFATVTADSQTPEVVLELKD